MSKSLQTPIPLSGKPGRPSAKLLKKESAHLRALLRSAGTYTELSRKLDIDRITLTRIIHKGFGSPENVRKIRLKLSRLAQAA